MKSATGLSSALCRGALQRIMQATTQHMIDKELYNKWHRMVTKKSLTAQDYHGRKNYGHEQLAFIVSPRVHRPCEFDYASLDRET